MSFRSMVSLSPTTGDAIVSLGLVARSPVKLGFLKTRSEEPPPFLVGAGACRRHVPPVLLINVRNKLLHVITHLGVYKFYPLGDVFGSWPRRVEGVTKPLLPP